MKISLEKIAEVVNGKVIGDDRVTITGIGSLDDAGPCDVSFFSDRRYQEALNNTSAGALLVSEENLFFKGPQVVVSNVGLAYAKVAGIFAVPPSRHPGISDDAIINKYCRIGKDVSIHPLVYVGQGAVIGDETVLFPGVFIGERVKIGKRSVIHPNVTILRDCLIGNEVVIHSGTIIGSDGFGFIRDGSTSVKIPQSGFVQIDDGVELGANNCVDRAALGKTWIKAGTKTDNLVHVGHNVVIGEDSIIVALAGISGSCNIGRQVVIGGQVGISDHTDIGDGAMVGSQSGVAKSIPPGEAVSGYPAIPHRLWLKTSALTSRLPQFNERIRHLEKRLKELEKILEQE